MRVIRIHESYVYKSHTYTKVIRITHVYNSNERPWQQVEHVADRIICDFANIFCVRSMQCVAVCCSVLQCFAVCTEKAFVDAQQVKRDLYLSKVVSLLTYQKRPPKETYMKPQRLQYTSKDAEYVKRDLYLFKVVYIFQKRPPKETWIKQKRLECTSKEIYIYIKKDRNKY